MTVHEIPSRPKLRPHAYAWLADPLTPTTFTVVEEGRVVIELQVRAGHILQRAAFMDALVDHLNST